MVVTKEWLAKFRSPNNGYFSAQTMALGLVYPPKKGWLKRIIGKEISEEQRIAFEAGATSKSKARKAVKNLNRSNIEIAAQLSKAQKTHRPIPSNDYVTTDAFLQSYEWRKLRMEALKLHGARCQCCGATPATGAIMNVDHIKPRRLFPAKALDLSNLQVLCHECNHGKGNWDQTDWRCTK
jgi:5-methylcytosine-specific restriction endonuclease McrA